MYDASVQLHALSLAVSLSKVSRQEHLMPRTPIAVLRSGCFGTGDNQWHTYLTAGLLELGRYNVVGLLRKLSGRELPPEVRLVAAGWMVLLARSLHAAGGILQQLHRGAVATAESVPVTSSSDLSSSSRCPARLPGCLAMCICSGFDRLRCVLQFLQCLNESIVDTSGVLRHWAESSCWCSSSSSSTSSTDSDSSSSSSSGGGSSSGGSSGGNRNRSSSSSCRGVQQSMQDINSTIDQDAGGQEAAAVSTGTSPANEQPAGSMPPTEQVGRLSITSAWLERAGLHTKGLTVKGLGYGDEV